MSTNPCIECSITNCAHHSHTSNYCALEKIKVGASTEDPTKTENTECCSFDVK